MQEFISALLTSLFRKENPYFLFQLLCCHTHTLGIFKAQSTRAKDLYAFLCEITRENLIGLGLVYMQNTASHDYFFNLIWKGKAWKTVGRRRKHHNCIQRDETFLSAKPPHLGKTFLIQTKSQRKGVHDRSLFLYRHRSVHRAQLLLLGGGSYYIISTYKPGSQWGTEVN